MVDVTEARLAEQRRRQSEDVFRQILEALPAAVYTTDAGGVLTYCNQAAVDIAGREPEIGKELWCISWRLYHPDGSPLAKDQCPMAVALKEGRPVLGEEIVVERPDGSRVPLVPFPAPLHDESGRLVGGVNVLVDISERKESERKLELLVRELNHRVKNTLAIVQALAQQTSRSTKSLDEFVASFGGRIQAMARSHALLSSTYWNGAALEALIRDELNVKTRRDGRITWSGPPVTLDPQVAVNVSLLIHELAANARRHGALSKARGALKVTWSLEGNSNELLRLEWSEMGIRRRRTSPARGFGSRLIERIVETYDGKARMELVDRGIAWIITLELPPGRTALEGKPSAPAETRARA